MYLKKEMERFGEVEAGFGAGRLIMLMISQNVSAPYCTNNNRNHQQQQHQHQERVC